MATITFYPTDAAAAGANFFNLQHDGSAPSNTATATGWTVDTVAPTKYCRMAFGVERTSGNFISSAAPAAAVPDNTLGDSFRSASTLTGTFAAGTWDIAFRVVAVTAGGSADGRMRFRVFRGSDATGVGATEITSAAQVCAAVTNLGVGSGQTSDLTTWNPGAVTLTGEYLFFKVAWEITGAAGGINHDVLLMVGPLARIITTDFSGSGSSADVTGSDTVTVTESATFSVAQSAVETVTLAEATTLSTGNTLVAASDSWTLSEASVVSGPAGGEAITLDDSESEVYIAESGPDIVFAESMALAVAVPVADAFALAESGSITVPAQFLTGSDPFTLGEANELSSTFPGIVVDQVGSDTVTFAEPSAYLGIPVTDSDSGTLGELGIKTVGQSTSASDFDSFVLAGEVPSLSADGSMADSGTFAESIALTVAVVASEGFTLGEPEVIAADLVESDAFTLTELTVVDTGQTGIVLAEISLVPRLMTDTAILPRLTGTAAVRGQE